MIKYYTLYELIFPICFLLVSLPLLGIGLKGLLRNESNIYKCRLGFGAMFLFCLPFFLLCLNMVFYGPRGGAPDLNDLGLIGIPCLMLWYYRFAKRSDGRVYQSKRYFVALTTAGVALVVSSVAIHFLA